MNQEIELYYWPLRYRGNIARLLLAEANVPYKDINDFEAVKKYVYGEPNKTVPTLFPPILKIGDFVLCQSSAICQYLAKKYGLDGEGDNQQAMTLMIFSHCNDFLIELTRGQGWYDLWNDERWQGWKEDTFKQYMQLFEDFLNKGNEYFVGAKLTYADLAVFTVLDGLIYDFQQEEFLKQYPHLLKFYYRILQKPNIKKLNEEQKSKNWPYCGGDIQRNIESVTLKQK